MINLTSPVTGSAQTGFTAPTYTITADSAVPSHGKQWAVTAIGGTQAGVTTHTASSPFTWAYFKPKFWKLLARASALTGLISNVPKNTSKVIVRKGVKPAVNAPDDVMIITITSDIPSGAESYDSANVKAAYSFAIGALTQQSAGIGDTVNSGLM